MAKRKKPKLKKMRVPRNPYAFDPIMKKGGVHEKTEKAKRKKMKDTIKKETQEVSF